MRNLILLMPAFFIKAMPRTRTKSAATEQFQLALSLQRLLTSMSGRSQLMTGMLLKQRLSFLHPGGFASYSPVSVFSGPCHRTSVNYQKAISPIVIAGFTIPFVTGAKHVGLVRSIDGNLPHIKYRKLLP